MKTTVTDAIKKINARSCGLANILFCDADEKQIDIVYEDHKGRICELYAVPESIMFYTLKK